MTDPNVQQDIQAALQRISRIMDNEREHEVCCAFDEYEDTPCNCSVAEDDAAFATICEACQQQQGLGGAMNFTPEQKAERENFVNLLRQDLSCKDGEAVRDAIARVKLERDEAVSLLRTVRASEDCLFPCCMRLGAYQYVQQSD